MKPFNLEEALAGKPVIHSRTETPIHNLTRIGDVLAFQVIGYGQSIFTSDLSGRNVYDHQELLGMASQEKTVYVNLWQSPSFHYTVYSSLEEAKASKGASYTGCTYSKLNKEPIALVILA